MPGNTLTEFMSKFDENLAGVPWVATVFINIIYIKAEIIYSFITIQNFFYRE